MLNLIVIHVLALLFALIGYSLKIPYTSVNDCLIYVSIGVFCHEIADLKNNKMNKIV